MEAFAVATADGETAQSVGMDDATPHTNVHTCTCRRTHRTSNAKDRGYVRKSVSFRESGEITTPLCRDYGDDEEADESGDDEDDDEGRGIWAAYGSLTTRRNAKRLDDEEEVNGGIDFDSTAADEDDENDDDGNGRATYGSLARRNATPLDEDGGGGGGGGGGGISNPAVDDDEEEGMSFRSIVDDGERGRIKAFLSAANKRRGGPQRRRRRRTGKELWALVRRRMKDGFFELHDMSVGTNEGDSDRAASFSGPRTGRAGEHAPLPYDFTIRECFLVFVAYLMVGLVAYSFCFERWPVVDSLYFTVVTFTTIGYGDYVPTTDHGRVFTSVFALTGVALLGIALGVVGSRIVEAEVQAVHKARNEASKKVMSIFDRSDKEHREWREMLMQAEAMGPTRAEAVPLRGNVPKRMTLSERALFRISSSSVVSMNDKASSSWAKVGEVLVRYLPASVPLLAGAFFMAVHEGWNWTEAVYYCVVTTTTIGFGDYTPALHVMKWFAVLFIPLSVGAMGYLIGTVANAIIEQRREVFQKSLEMCELTVEDLDAMDTSGDGTVSMNEYVEFMLVAMKKVDRELLEDLHCQFHRMDLTKSGTLVKRDLQLMAQKRLRKVRTKLQLYSYKQKLKRSAEEARPKEKKFLQRHASTPF